MKSSLIITTYNYGQYIERCIRSCLNQRFVDSESNEILVVDDASTDDTVARLAKFQAHRNFRLIVNDTNLGVAASANKGILAAEGHYVVRVDADDFVSELLVFFLSSYLQANPEAFGVFCDYFLFNEKEEKVERRDASQYPISCGIMYRRDRLIEAGLYNPEFRHREEEELRRRLGEHYQILHLKMPLYRYRMHDSNKTKSPEYEAFRKRVDSVRPRTGRGKS
jgi:glycosyltransferase involved in cell wall biosynthesis